MKIYLANTTAECIETASNVIKPYKGFEDKSCYLFCEDKITLNQEFEIASKNGGFFGVEVLTFKRYVRLNNKKGNLLSKEASVMSIRKILNQLSNELRCFNAKIYRPNLASNVYETISQLESAKVTPETLSELLTLDKNVSTALKNKIYDLHLIFKAYKKHLEDNGYLDSNDYLSLAPEIIRKDEKLKGAQIILVGFNSVTKQRADIIKALSEVTSDLSSVILGDEKSEIYTNEPLEKLKAIVENCEVIPSSKKLTAEALFIKDYLYNPVVFKEGFNQFSTKNVMLYEAINPVSETEFIAKEILSEVRKGKRFKDIALSVGNLKDYVPIIKRVFNEYKIPYYIDSPSLLSEHPITAYVISYIDLIKRGLNTTEFLRFISSGLFLVDKNLSDGLKKYVLKNALVRSNFKKPFEYFDNRLEEYEALRNVVYECYLMGEKAKTVRELVNAVKYMLEKTKAFENMQTLGKHVQEKGELKIFNVNEKVPEKLLSVLDEMNFVLGDTSISILDFKNIFTSGVSGTEISVLPLFNDAVFVGECKDVKIKTVSVLFYAGLNGDIPYSKSDTAFLNDNDLLRLDELKVIVEPKIKIVNKREMENVGTQLLSFNEKLILTYCSTSLNGGEAFKSEIINYFLKAFNLTLIKESEIKNLKINSKTILNSGILKGFITEKTSLKEILKYSGDKKLDNPDFRKVVSVFYQGLSELGYESAKNKADALLSRSDRNDKLNLSSGDYFKNKLTSASAIERYFNCPYSAFASNVLKLKNLENGEMQVYETGTMLHSLIELYVKDIEEVKDNESSDNLVSKIIKNLLSQEEYSRYLNKPQYKFTFSRLEKEGKRVCFAIYKSLKNSEFKPYLLEASFNDNSKFKAIKLNTKNGEYKIQGKIDRVDKYKNNIRIIDYKSGNIDAGNEAFYSGRKLQLYLYLNAFISDGFKPAGTYYFPVHDKFMDKKDKTYQMRGRTVDEEEILSATDVNLLNDKTSEYVSVKINKDGSSSKRSEILTQEEMQSYLKYALKVAENAIDEINSGFIKPTPYKDACNYCKYGGMCGFDMENGVERQCKNVTKETIIKAVNGKKEEN